MTPHGNPLFPLAPRNVLTLSGVLVLCAVLCFGGAREAGAGEDLPAGGEIEAPAPGPGGPAARAAAILDQDFQTELPDPAPPADKSAPRGIRVPARALLPNILVKIGLILGGVLVLATLLNLFFATDRWAGRDDPAVTEADGFDFERLNLGDPDLLAAEERYADAIHAMLLRALALSAGRLNLTWPHSLTSREILGSASLTEQAREHLNDLVTRVEIHHFGGRPPRAEDFHHCRLVYERLAADPIKGQS